MAGECTSRTRCTRRGTSSSTPTASAAGWSSWTLLLTAPCSSTRSFSWISMNSAVTKSDCRVATLPRTSTAIHESCVALDGASAPRGLSRPQSSYGLAICLGARFAGEAEISGFEGPAPDCSRTRNRDRDHDSPSAFRGADPSPTHAQVGHRGHSLHSWHLPHLPSQSSPRGGNESRRKRVVCLVFPHGVGSRIGINGRASPVGPTDDWDDAHHGSNNAWESSATGNVSDCAGRVGAHRCVAYRGRSSGGLIL